MPRFATRWSCTPRSAGRRICCCTSPPSPTPPGCRGRRSTTGSPSTARCRGWWTSLPNGPHPTVRVFLAGGVPEVMLHLRALGPARRHRHAPSPASARRRARLVGGLGAPHARCASACATRRRRSRRRDHVARTRPRARGLTSTVSFSAATSRPKGAVVKSTAIDPSRRRCRRRLPHDRPGARLHHRARGHRRDQEPRRRPHPAGDVLVLICRGPLGAGMEEIYQVTSALKYLTCGKQVALLTDARFSGVSTGACIGHIGPEALAGGPIGKLRDGDRIRVVIDRNRLEGRIDLVGRRRRRRECRRTRSSRGATPRAGPGAPTRTCRPTPASGRRCSTSAAAPGAGASTTSTR